MKSTPGRVRVCCAAACLCHMCVPAVVVTIRVLYGIPLCVFFFLASLLYFVYFLLVLPLFDFDLCRFVSSCLFSCGTVSPRFLYRV